MIAKMGQGQPLQADRLRPVRYDLAHTRIGIKT